jgi:hypothetical protein
MVVRRRDGRLIARHSYLGTIMAYLLVPAAYAILIAIAYGALAKGAGDSELRRDTLAQLPPWFFPSLVLIPVTAIAAAIFAVVRRGPFIVADLAAGGAVSIDRLTLPTASVAAVESVWYTPPIGKRIWCGVAAVIRCDDERWRRLMLVSPYQRQRRKRRFAARLATGLDVPLRDGARFEVGPDQVFLERPVGVSAPGAAADTCAVETALDGQRWPAMQQRKLRLGAATAAVSRFVVREGDSGRPTLVGVVGLRESLAHTALMGLGLGLAFTIVIVVFMGLLPPEDGMPPMTLAGLVGNALVFGVLIAAVFPLMTVIEWFAAGLRPVVTGPIDAGGVLDVNLDDVRVRVDAIAAVEVVHGRNDWRRRVARGDRRRRRFESALGVTLVVRDATGLRRVWAIDAQANMLASSRRLARQLADILDVPLRDGHAGEVDADGRFVETPPKLAA